MERKLSNQMIKHSKKEVQEAKQLDGNTELIVSTGSTLLDLAISGGRIHGGGLPAGILVEVFGPSGTGKTVLLCEIAGAVQRLGGQIKFKDPEARLNKQFAKLFDLEVDESNYDIPNTVAEVFAPLRKWKPSPQGKVHGIFADSLAALSTEMEMDDKDGMGMRRAKEFSEECRKTCRVITNENFLMVCSNQVRQNAGATNPYSPKYVTPGGEAIPFYSSLRLKCSISEKITSKKTIKGKEISRVVGVKTDIEVVKSSVWKPYHTASIYIMFDYGIDNIRSNLKFLKQYGNEAGSKYFLGGESLGNSIESAITTVEENNLENELCEEVITVWESIEQQFSVDRKRKVR